MGGGILTMTRGMRMLMPVLTAASVLAAEAAPQTNAADVASDPLAVATNPPPEPPLLSEPVVPAIPELNPPPAPGGGKEQEGQASFQLLLPAESDQFSRALGGEAQWRRWMTEHFGFALAAGVQAWSVESGELELDDNHFTPAETSGDVTVYPLGASLLLRSAPEEKKIRIVGEAGLRYAFVDSGAEVSFEYVDHWGANVRIEDTVPLDDRVWLTLGLRVSGPISDRWGWMLGAGYQFDLAGGDENWHHQAIANDFQAAVFSAGVFLEL